MYNLRRRNIKPKLQQKEKKPLSPMVYYIIICIIYIIFWILIPIILIGTDNTKGLNIFYILLNGIIWLGIMSGISIGIYFLFKTDKDGKSEFSKLKDQVVDFFQKQINSTINTSVQSASAGLNVGQLAQQFMPGLASQQGQAPNIEQLAQQYAPGLIASSQQGQAPNIEQLAQQYAPELISQQSNIEQLAQQYAPALASSQQTPNIEQLAQQYAPELSQQEPSHLSQLAQQYASEIEPILPSFDSEEQSAAPEIEPVLPLPSFGSEEQSPEEVAAASAKEYVADLLKKSN